MTILFVTAPAQIYMNIGDNIHIKQNVKHRFTELKDSRIIKFSTQHFDSDLYRIEKSGMAKWKTKNKN